MTMGRPVADLDDFLEEAPPRLRPAPAPTPTPVVKPSRARWLIATAAFVVAAAGVGYWLLTGGAEPTGSGSVSGPAPAGETVPHGVTGFAELFVTAYLGGDQQELAVFLPSSPALDAMTPGAHVVRHAAAIEAAPVGADYWAVVVAADVLDLEEAGYIAAGLAYFQVGVVDDGGRLVATALPSRVAAPAARTATPRSLAAADGEPAPETAALVGDFFEALLTGERDVSRYTEADGSIAAIRPAPYVAIAVTAIAEFGDGAILATVDAQGSNGAVDTLQYVLRVENHGGGPVVAELMAGPPQIDRGQE